MSHDICLDGLKITESAPDLPGEETNKDSSLTLGKSKKKKKKSKPKNKSRSLDSDASVADCEPSATYETSSTLDFQRLSNIRSPAMFMSPSDPEITEEQRRLRKYGNGIVVNAIIGPRRTKSSLADCSFGSTNVSTSNPFQFGFNC